MTAGEFFVTEKPRSQKLKGIVSYYYFHRISQPDTTRRIAFYPNTINAVTIYRNARLDFRNRNFSTTVPFDGFHTYYSGIRQWPGVSEMTGPFDKIAIAFEPLGINRILNQPLSHCIATKNDWNFHALDATLLPVLPEIYDTENIAERVQLHDAFILSQLQDFDEPMLENAIGRIHDSEATLTVSAISEGICTSSKTLNRKFLKHLNCTVKEYLDVHQFRKSFDHFLSGGQLEKLTDLAYQFDYYDQSEFIRKFRKLTGINPKRLFGSVQHFGQEKLFWGN